MQHDKVATAISTMKETFSINTAPDSSQNEDAIFDTVEIYKYLLQNEDTSSYMTTEHDKSYDDKNL